MKLKKYLVYVDDGRNVYRIAVPTKSEKAAREYVEGNGEVIAVKDASEYLNGAGAVDYLSRTLKNAHYGAVEQDLIIRALIMVGMFGDDM